MIILLILITIYIYIYERIDQLYLKPVLLNTDYNLENLINIENKHYAIYENRNTNRILLIAKGNGGNLKSFKNIFDQVKNIYKYDLIYFEYPGFGLLNSHKANIDNCVEETYFWIKYLNKFNYQKIDLMGYSIGGGIIIETIIRYNITNINNIYLLSTFSSIDDVLYSSNIYNYFLQLLFLKKNNLNTYKNLNFIYCNNLYIMHSKDDEIINYDIGIKNYYCETHNIKNKIFIEIFGDHDNPLFNNINLLK
jgi:esterase/lipase